MLSLVAVSVALSACARQFEEMDVEDVPVGEPARVTLTVVVPDMPSVTRAAGIDPDGTAARTVNDLWIGFYNSNGARVGKGYVDNGGAYNHHYPYGNIKINNISTSSGPCTIVAVANVGASVGNQGIVIGEDDEPATLKSLLDDAKTFDDFKRIAMVMRSHDAVVRPGATLVMCGTYTENRSGSHPNNDEITPVVIRPGNNTLTGAIHLRRLDSYIRFNIQAGQNVTVTPVSWQVCNLPGVSYLFEQNNADGTGKNAADMPVVEGSKLWTSWNAGEDTGQSDNINASYYHNSQVFGANMFTPVRDNNGNGNLTGGYTFDFYQMENKHTGIISGEGTDGDMYNLREREFKTTGSDGINEGLNTGWYSSLVASPGPVIPAGPTSDPKFINNNASFVVIRARVEYYYRIDDNGTPESNYRPVDPPADPNDSRYVRRVGDAIYTIHLGYCDGKDGSGNPTLATANDFNCFRNTKYTYNVTIHGVDNIRVEAVREPEGTEPQSGAEGTVTDLVSTLFDLDSHYGVLNIALTNAQRNALIWRISAPFDNQMIDLVGYGKGAQGDIYSGSKMIDVTAKENYRAALPKNQFYNWIQIRPTSGEEVIAEYPGDPRLIGRVISNVDNQAGDNHQKYPVNNIEPNPYWDKEQKKIMGIFPVDYDKTEASDKIGTEIKQIEGENKGVWYLEQLCDPVHFPHPDAPNEGEDSDKLHWYTFFIDEYVYEYEYKQSSDWLTDLDYDLLEDSKFIKGLQVTKTMDIDRWRTFVNQDSRRLWLTLGKMDISKDTESIYSNAIYQITQESIQTYYGGNAPDGIGLEHTNESYIGALNNNLGNSSIDDPGYWTFEDYNDGTYDPVDGLQNMYYFVTKNSGVSIVKQKINGSINILRRPSAWAGRGNVSWADIRQTTGTNDKTTKFRKGVVRTKGVIGKEPNIEEGEKVNHTYYIPDHPNSYMMACLARNRDLNHDDIVGANEIRWYLPTAAVYTRMVLGGISLRSPIFNLTDYSPTSLEAGTGHPSSHYATSDGRFLYAEEFASVDDNLLTLDKSLGGTAAYPARTLRCVRNLGQETNIVPDDDASNFYKYELINAAYKRKKDGEDRLTNIVEMTFYHDVALRTPTQGIIGPHFAGDIMSYPSRSFKFATADISVGNQNSPGNGMNGSWKQDIYTVCSNYSEDNDQTGGWRVPNISEISILMYLDIAESKENWILNHDENIRYLSCTFEYFVGQDYRILKARPYQGFSTADGNGFYYVRCVKDVIE